MRLVRGELDAIVFERFDRLRLGGREISVYETAPRLRLEAFRAFERS